MIQAWPAIPGRAGRACPACEVRNLSSSSGSIPGPGWTIADYFELGNDAPATLVASENGPTWSHALPPGASGFRVGQSDLPAGIGELPRGGRVQRLGPAAPRRETSTSFGYTVAADRFTIPMEGTTGSMELLIREPAGEISVTGLANRAGGRDGGDRATAVSPAGAWRRRSSPSLEGEAEEPPGLDAPGGDGLLALALAGAGALVAARSRSPRGRRCGGDGPGGSCSIADRQTRRGAARVGGLAGSRLRSSAGRGSWRSLGNDRV